MTMLAGAIVGGGVLVASMLATASTPAQRTAATTAVPAVASAVPAVASASASVAARPSAPALPTAPAKARYKAWLPGGSLLTIWVRDGHATAYVCNGNTIEAWYRGTATNGELKLTGKNLSLLRASYDAHHAVGYLLLNSTRYSFTARS